MGDGQFESPTHLAVDRTGTVYVADTANNRVQKFDANGRFLLKWGGKGTGDGQFAFTGDAPDGFGIAVDGSGAVYVADTNNNRIQKFDPNGQLLRTWGGAGSGDGQFNRPFDIAADATGNIYVADGINHRVQKFDPNGQFLLKWGGEGTGNGQFQYASGVTVDGPGNVYVADTGATFSRVQKFDASGRFILAWGSYGRGDGQMRAVLAGLAADGAGNVYIADNRNNRIEKFRQR
jgi:DNA-binding beta-propeller fold protein YncE